MRSRKGFTLIEVLCSISIFSVLILFSIAVKVNEIKISKTNYETVKCMYFMDCLKKEISVNATEEDIKNLIAENKIYVSKDKIYDDNKAIDLNSLFSNNRENKEPYLILSSNGAFGEKQEIKLSMYANFYGKEKVYTCTLEK